MLSKARRRGSVGRRIAVAALLVAMLPALPGCTSREERLLSARDRALEYFHREVTQIEVGWSVVFGYLQRRFGVTVAVADGRTLHDAREDVEPPEMFAIFGRLVDTSSRVEIIQIAELESPIDRISASAIHCREIPLPDDWVEILFKASRKGAYALTHSVAAAQWTLENGCRQELQLAALHAEQIQLLEALLWERDRLERRHAAATDIWIEALAMLFYARAGDRVRPEWIETLLGLQRRDGGWAAHPRAPRSDPHTTALALWVILETLEPDAPRVAWIAGR